MNIRKMPVEFVTITPTMRGLIENVIEDLLLLLDEIDGDENMPDLAGFDPRLMDGREDDADFEPSSCRAAVDFSSHLGSDLAPRPAADPGQAPQSA